MILLTGANGQVGREIVGRAKALPVAIHALTRKELDITDAAAVRQAVSDCQADLIVNAAAYTAVDRAEDEPETAFRVNRDGAEHLADAAYRAGIPLVHLSTDYVFDGTSREPYKPSDPASPIGVYGRSKWEGEVAVRDRLARHLIVRVSWVFGINGHNFVKTMLRLARERDEVKVVADQIGGPTYAGHIADFVLALCRRIACNGRVPWGTYHYSGAPTVTWHAFATSIIEAGCRFGLLDHPVAVHPIETKDYPTRARRPARSVLDCRSLEIAFGLARPSWEEG
jgi:dTDP-4-dehydrorhamnose reductase